MSTECLLAYYYNYIFLLLLQLLPLLSCPFSLNLLIKWSYTGASCPEYLGLLSRLANYGSPSVKGQVIFLESFQVNISDAYKVNAHMFPAYRLRIKCHQCHSGPSAPLLPVITTLTSSVVGFACFYTCRKWNHTLFVPGIFHSAFCLWGSIILL